MKTLYLAIEGIDGSGKSCQIKNLLQYVIALGLKPREYRFTDKGNSICGKLIQKIYGGPPNSVIVAIIRRMPFAQMMLYALNARINLRKALQNSNFDVLVGDRSIVTSYIVHDALFQKHPYLKVFEPNLLPDYVLLLDLDSDTAYERLKGRPIIGIDENIKRMKQMRNLYIQFANGQIPDELQSIKWHIIDASLPINLVSDKVKDWVVSCLSTDGFGDEKR